MKKFVGNSVVLFVSLIIFSACAFPFQDTVVPELSDISSKLSYNEISRQAFIGGSLLYSPTSLSSGHIYPGVNVAVRLGKVDKTEESSGLVSYTDRADDARYGYITIDTADEKQITFTYNQYDLTGQYKVSSAHMVLLNESIDINNDGITDIAYTVPLQKRPGLEKALYLTFTSSQEKQNTSMFAVLPQQYSRGAYPNGLIGINPSGHFIVAKYEHEKSTNRSAVKGMVYGDYVLDYSTGKYQKVTGAGKYSAARSIDDVDLTDIGSIGEVKIYFSLEEFNEALSAKNLFEALPETIRKKYYPENLSNEVLLPVLNNILESYDLIENVAAVMDIGLTESQMVELKNSIYEMALPDLVKLNRAFMAQAYPDLCPNTFSTPDEIAFILPLIFCSIRGDSTEQEMSRGVATSYNDYVAEKNNMRSRWSGYYAITPTIPFINIPYPDFDTSDLSVPFNGNNQAAIGVKAVISNHWGSSLELRVGIAAFVQIEIFEATLADNFPPTSLINGPKTILNLVNVNIPIGPIVFTVDCPVQFDIILDINGNINFKTPYFMGFVGLISADAYAGINYGITWKQFWFISYPEFYFRSFFGGTEGYANFTFYAGPVDNTVVSIFEDFSPVTVTDASTSINITPKFTFTPRLSLFSIISAGFPMSCGVYGNLTVTALPNGDQLILQGKSPIAGYLSYNAFAKIAVESKILMGNIPVVNLFYREELPLGSLSLLNKEFGTNEPKKIF